MPLEANTRVIVLALLVLVGAVVYFATAPERSEVKETGRITFAFALLALLWALCVVGR